MSEKQDIAGELIEMLNKKRQTIAKQIEYIRQHADKINAVGVKPSIFGTGIDFDNVPRSKVGQLLQAFGGKWDKKLNSHEKTKLDYVQDVGGITVRLWKADPPPTCKLVAKQVVIPAVPERIETKYELVCDGDKP